MCKVIAVSNHCLLYTSYWCAKNEEKERKQDIAYMKRKFPQTEFTKLPDLGHGGLVLLKPEVFSEMICKLS